MGRIDERLAELEITLPEPPVSVGAYVPWLRTGNLVAISGQLPLRDGQVAYIGKLGQELTVPVGRKAAELCAINAIAQLRAAAGDLDRVTRIVRVEGFVHSATGFHQQPLVLDGASELFLKVFDDAGRHTRFAVGASELPLNAAVEIGLWAEVQPA